MVVHALSLVSAQPVRPPLGRPDTRESCCRRECDYRLERVEHHLSRLLAYQRAGEQTGQIYAAAAFGRFGGAPADGETASIDVGRVVEQLRAEGQAITAEAVAARLCPRALAGVEGD